MCDQIEFANVLVLNKCDVISVEDQEKAEILIRKLNPNAIIHRSIFGRIDPRLVLNTHLFSLKEAEKAPQWLKEARIGEHKPESVEFGISNFTFRAVRPFHPDRLHSLVIDIESKNGVMATVLRMKGFTWFANHMEGQGIVAFAGRNFSITPGAFWWATIDRESWPTGLSDAITPLWHEPYGDRQNELVVIGRYMDVDQIREAFKSCLLTDEEYALGPDVWLSFADPFASSWVIDESHEHQHEHHHDHSNSERGHCDIDHDHSHGHDHDHR